jgi:hypothetical protein
MSRPRLSMRTRSVPFNGSANVLQVPQASIRGRLDSDCCPVQVRLLTTAQPVRPTSQRAPSQTARVSVREVVMEPTVRPVERVVNLGNTRGACYVGRSRVSRSRASRASRACLSFPSRATCRSASRNSLRLCAISSSDHTSCGSLRSGGVGRRVRHVRIIAAGATLLKRVDCGHQLLPSAAALSRVAPGLSVSGRGPSLWPHSKTSGSNS